MCAARSCCCFCVDACRHLICAVATQCTIGAVATQFADHEQSCGSDTGFEHITDWGALNVFKTGKGWHSYLIFCLFACCYETRKSILPPWVGSKVQHNPCFSSLCFSHQKKLSKILYHTTVCGTNAFPKGKTWILSWNPTNQPHMHVRKKTIILSLDPRSSRIPYASSITTRQSSKCAMRREGTGIPY